MLSEILITLEVPADENGTTRMLQTKVGLIRGIKQELPVNDEAFLDKLSVAVNQLCTDTLQEYYEWDRPISLE